jgi:uncharacterized membrane protein
MSGMKEFIRTTIIGGALFMIPVALLIFVLSQAMAMVEKIAAPIAEAWPGEEILGVGVVTIVSALVLLVVSFLAGLFARTGFGRRVKNWLETSLFGKVPQYQMLKSMAEGLTQVRSSEQLSTALVQRDGAWQLGFVMDQVGTQVTAVFLPVSPTTMTGTVVYVPTERVRHLDLPVSDAVMLVQKLGMGSADVFKEIDLAEAMRRN